MQQEIGASTMSKKKNQKVIDQHFLFTDITTVTREELLDSMRYWKSCGGHNPMAKYIRGLIFQIAILRGFEPITYEEADIVKWNPYGYGAVEETELPPGRGLVLPKLDTTLLDAALARLSPKRDT